MMFLWKTKTLIAVSLLLVSCTCMASFKSFEAPIDNSIWRFEGNPINCQLSHTIPLYGDAEFKQSAGSKQTLEFKLGYKRHKITSAKVAALRSIAPAWRSKQTNRELGDVKINAGNNIIIAHNQASWRLLNELEIGRFPTFFYQDFETKKDQVSVALSTIGFVDQYDKFLNCLAVLVPFKLHELDKMTLYFSFNKSSIKSAYQKKLRALAAYIKYEPSIEVVFINGYTDSKGPRFYNQKLSERRVDSVKRILSLEGVDDSRFKTQAFGEKKPAASNSNDKGRAKNRRVFIKIAQQ